MTRKLTREWLQHQISAIEAVGITDSNTLSAFKLALAAMDSEPVAEVLSSRPGNDTSTIDRALPVGTQLYRHAQQPVVPPMQHWEELCRQYPDMSIRDAIIRAAWWNHCRAAMLQELQKIAGEPNNCRSNENVQVMQDVSRCSTKAAPVLDSSPKTAESRCSKSPMWIGVDWAKGFEPGNSPVIPDGWTCNDKANAALMMLDRIETVDPVDDDRIDGIKRIVRELASATQPQNAPQNIPEIIPDCWCRTCRPVVLNDMRFVVCPDCGNKRCPRANDHRNACTGSNEPGQEGSAYPDTPREVK